MRFLIFLGTLGLAIATSPISASELTCQHLVRVIEGLRSYDGSGTLRPDPSLIAQCNERSAIEILNQHLKKVDYHSHVLNQPDSTTKLNFVGIGVVTLDSPNGLFVSNILKNSPAEKAQLKVSDIILEINGEAPDRKRLLGERGSPITLLIDSNGRRKEISLSRDLIHRNDLSTSIIDASYGYLQIPYFYAGIADSIQSWILAHKELKALVLDLRGSYGGKVEEIKKIAGFFLGKNPIYQEAKYTGNDAETRVVNATTELIFDRPIVVLVDPYTMSAGEILAAAIQDYQRGIIIGKGRTFGKGTQQETLIYEQFDELVRITKAQTLRVTGVPIQHDGVTPDIFISEEENENETVVIREEDFLNTLVPYRRGERIDIPTPIDANPSHENKSIMQELLKELSKVAMLDE